MGKKISAYAASCQEEIRDIRADEGSQWYVVAGVSELHSLYAFTFVGICRMDIYSKGDVTDCVAMASAASDVFR